MRTFLLSALGLVALAGSAAAQALPTEIWAGGVIVKVDSAARTVDVRQGASEQTYVLAADAEIKDGNKTVTASELIDYVNKQVPAATMSKQHSSSTKRSGCRGRHGFKTCRGRI